MSKPTKSAEQKRKAAVELIVAELMKATNPFDGDCLLVAHLIALQDRVAELEARLSGLGLPAVTDEGRSCAIVNETEDGGISISNRGGNLDGNDLQLVIDLVKRWMLQYHESAQAALNKHRTRLELLEGSRKRSATLEAGHARGTRVTTRGRR